MAPHLRVLAGPSPTHLEPITSLVNTNGSHHISSALFEGDVVVNIKGFTNDDTTVKESPYFDREDRQGITWSIQMRGRFLVPCSADDILFGNTFDKPLKLPWGSSAAFKFMQYVDPTLTHDLTSSTKPWALSPLISTMPHFAHTRLEDESATTIPANSITLAHTSFVSCSSQPPDDQAAPKSKLSKTKSRLTAKLKPKSRKKPAPPTEDLSFPSASARRTFFSDELHRRRLTFGPHDLITTDFCYGFLEFSPSLALRIPGGLSFDLVKYWDGQPVRDANSLGGDHAMDAPQEEEVFWCVSIEMADS
ncbi:hypothetical protein BD779DRAFT_1611562 [Infundibulicybe gibba]|nr:hypothetical protein BD779DRAFT_1611562 [Infundibulicybe gibba]